MVPSFRPQTSCVLTWQKGQGSFSGLFYKDTNNHSEGFHSHDQITSQRRSHLLIPLHWSVGFQHMNLEGKHRQITAPPFTGSLQRSSLSKQKEASWFVRQWQASRSDRPLLLSIQSKSSIFQWE